MIKTTVKKTKYKIIYLNDLTLPSYMIKNNSQQKPMKNLHERLPSCFLIFRLYSNRRFSFGMQWQAPAFAVGCRLTLPEVESEARVLAARKIQRFRRDAWAGDGEFGEGGFFFLISYVFRNFFFCKFLF